jgi:AraC-like DNA-binding protein
MSWTEPFVVDGAYEEREPPVCLNRHVAAFWIERSRPDGRPFRDRVLPDGFVDIVWGRSLWVRGADTRMHAIRPAPGSTFLGVRLRPGAAQSVLGIPGTTIVDRRVFLAELWGDAAHRLAERLETAASVEAARGVLEAAILERLARSDHEPDCAVDEVARHAWSRPPLSVRRLADDLGLSERQLLRRCRSAVGYGPKTLDRIIRFQRFRALFARSPALGLARSAALAGYADQPHLTRECRRLAGETPLQLVTRELEALA